MNDQELIARLRDKAPDELAPEDIELLRQRLPHSPELQVALRDELHLEEVLGEHLGRFEVSLDRIYGETPVPPHRRWPAWMGWAVALCLLATAGIYTAIIVTRPPEQLANVPEASASAEVSADAASTGSPSAATTGGKPPRPVASGESTTREVMPAATSDTGEKPVVIEDPEPLAVVMRRPASLVERYVDERVQDIDAFRKRFEPVGHGGSINPHHRYPRFEGLFRFKEKWPPNAALRIGFFDTQRLQIFCWNGNEGVLLQLHHEPRATWAAYGITRDPGQPRPKELALYATDDARFDRVGKSGVEIRHEQGQLRLVRGNVELLRVPLAEAPQEVLFDGAIAFRQLEFVEPLPLPFEPDPLREITFRTAAPGKLAAAGKPGAPSPGPVDVPLPPQAAISTDDAGRLILTTTAKIEQEARAFVPLPETGLHEVIFAVDNPQPGTGVYLGDASGKPLYRVGLFRETHANQVAFGFVNNGDNRFDARHEPFRQVIPFAGKRTWLKLVAGAGTLKCLTSADGNRWSLVGFPARQQLGPVTTAGIYCVPGDAARQVKLAHLEVQQITPLYELAPRELLAAAPSLPMVSDVGEWLRKAIEMKPAAADETAWRRACVIKTLPYAPPGPVAEALLAGLVHEAVRDERSTAECLAILREAVLLAPSSDEKEVAQWANEYVALGERLRLAGEPWPARVVFDGLVKAPFATWSDVRPLRPELIESELLAAVSREAWDEVLGECELIRLACHYGHPNQEYNYSLRGLVQWASWAEAHASRNGNRQAIPGDLSFALEARHPLEEQLSKESYNVLAEFEAALKGQAYRDACMIITSARPSGTMGLVPDSRDRRLSVSLLGAVALAMRETPALQDAMEEEFGPIGRLRVREAITTQNVSTIEAATTQFYGTEACSEAHAWLGDRALALGDFSGAEGRYRQALQTAPIGARPQLTARIRLAAAYQGRESQAPVTHNVTLGEVEFDGAGFESLLSGIRSQQSGARERLGPALENTGYAIGSDWPIARYDMQPWARYEGEMGSEGDRVPYKDFDWAAQQLATVVVGEMLIVNNRFQLSAFDLKTGQQKWRCDPPQQGKTHDWSLVPMRPTVAGNRIFVRRLTRRGPELAAVDRQNGKVLWRQQPGHHISSDPLLVGDDLYVLGVASLANDFLQVDLVRFAPETGEMLSRHRLAQFRNVWDSQIPCQAVLFGDSIIAAVGGTVLSCDLQGQPKWLRRQPWVSRFEDQARTPWLHTPPIIHDGKVYVTQPFVPYVECLEAASGRMLWSQSFGGMHGLVGMMGERVVVQTSEGLAAISAKDGKQLWFHPVDDQLGGTWCGGNSLVFTRKLTIPQQDRRVAQLVWLDLASGREMAATTLPKVDRQQIQFGPLVWHGEKMLAFYGENDRDPRRELVELKSKGPLETQVPLARTLTAYQQPLLPQIVEGAQILFPEWRVLASVNGAGAGYTQEFERETHILATTARPAEPAAIARWLVQPEGMQSRLKLRVGRRPGQPWRLSIYAGSERLKVVEVNDETAKNAWCDVEVDLPRSSGQPMLIELVHECPGASTTAAGWKRIEIERR